LCLLTRPKATLGRRVSVLRSALLGWDRFALSIAHRATQAACKPLNESSGQYPVFRGVAGRRRRGFCEWRVSSASRANRQNAGISLRERVGGYTLPDGGRKYFGALLVGYNGPAGRLLYAGRVGSGFSERALAVLYGGLQTIRRATCPSLICPKKGRGAGV
jgi:ATP dependent DNA ligase C terminal region